ncbi:MAG: ATP-dependent DNA ligase [Alphaproteobacteria bacterium]|nr:ATP-dependent DNA ligase [Alphaproteobacteria bacterium]
MSLPLPTSISAMEARVADTLPHGTWQFEPKWDGFRCLAFKEGKFVTLMAKSGKALTSYFPEMEAALSRLAGSWVLDGELVIPVGEQLSFDALQMRLHPAESRRRKLAAQTPAVMILFDLLAEGRTDFTAKPLSARRARLEKLVAGFGAQERLRLSPYTRDRAVAQKWLKQAGRGSLDGVIAKPLEGPYASGERAMVKVKNLKTADCVVGGFRYATGSRQVGSLLLGLFNEEGRLDHVGFTSGFAGQDRAALTRRLLALKAEPGFSGNAPGGPSCWSTERSAVWVPVRNKLVAEVRYDHVTDGRFRHGTKFLRWRPDKAVRSCTFDQLQPEMRPGKVFANLFDL